MKTNCLLASVRRNSSWFVTALALLAAAATALAQSPAPAEDVIATKDGNLVIRPINHATFVMTWNGKTIYVDPVGGAKAFANLPAPDLILLTDIHGDHFSKETLAAVGTKARLVAPPAVNDQLSEDWRARTTVLGNGQTQTVLGIPIEGIAAYNLAPERQKFHAKGRGNGYVVTLGGKRVYISGDTEDIPEMRALKEIDVAFLCMNLPYTMTVEQAADAVKAFKPKIVYPYHSRGSDLKKFQQLVGTDAGVEVRLRDWYKRTAP